MRLLALDAALGWCSAVLMENGAIIAERAERRAHGQAEALPLLVAELLADNPRLDIVAATTGPGSFTGLRAALALAQGLALGAGARTVGIPVPDAIRHAVAPVDCWVVLPASRDRLFLDRGQGIELIDQAALPVIPPGLALAGDAAASLAPLLAEQCATPAILENYQPLARAVAGLAQGLAQGWPASESRPLMPLYIDEPAIRQAALRPPPQWTQAGT